MTYQNRRGLTSDDLFGVRWLDEPRLTHDGRRLAYAMTGLDRERDAMLSWVRVGMGESAREYEGGSPCWSPDGATLAFVSADQRRLRLWTGGDDPPRDLLAQPDPITHPRWSPDGGRIAFISVGRVWLADLTGGAARALTDGSFQADLPVWLNSDSLGCVSVAPDGVMRITTMSSSPRWGSPPTCPAEPPETNASPSKATDKNSSTFPGLRTLTSQSLLWRSSGYFSTNPSLE